MVSEGVWTVVLMGSQAPAVPPHETGWLQFDPLSCWLAYLSLEMLRTRETLACLNVGREVTRRTVTRRKIPTLQWEVVYQG